jgi:hypothetical protein
MSYDFDYVYFTNDCMKNTNTTELVSLPDSNNSNNSNNSNDYNDSNDHDDSNDYDETTTEQYRTLRLYKFDPIMNEPIPRDLMFEFKYKWDPFTGQRKAIDKMGSLYFNAWNLYQYYYSNRSNGLWCPPVQQFQGYYGDLLGCGKDMMINARPCPEKYLYKLPIIDCYLKKSHNHSIITMGPTLTNEEIDILDVLTCTHRKNKPSLKILKEYYDQALNDLPDISPLKKINPELSDKELIEKYNRSFVDKLVNAR